MIVSRGVGVVGVARPRTARCRAVQRWAVQSGANAPRQRLKRVLGIAGHALAPRLRAERLACPVLVVVQEQLNERFLIVSSVAVLSGEPPLVHELPPAVVRPDGDEARAPLPPVLHDHIRALGQRRCEVEGDAVHDEVAVDQHDPAVL